MRPVPVLVVVALALSACGGEDQASARVVAAPVLEVAVGPVDVGAAEPPPTATTTTPTAEPADPCAGRVDRLDAGLEPVPERLRDRLAFVLASPMWGDVDRSISVWVDGFGEVLAQGADERLLPASNQKIFTAVGVALELHPDDRFETSVHQQGNDLVLVAGGDPTLSATGTHSLAELARQVAASGVSVVDRVIVDATHFEPAISAPGWLDSQMPAYVGPLSAFIVDDNRYRYDDAYLAEPAVGNGELFVFLLAKAGVAVNGPVAAGVFESGDEVARVESETVAGLVDLMMTDSDNEVAEALLRQIGGGSTTAGVDRIDERLEEWCLDLAGESGDGSGLGRASRRSAREWRRLLQVVAEQGWASRFRESLAVAGRTGTLEDRFVGTPAEGAVQAKTGSILGGRSLSGYTTTADGRDVVFSVILNGDDDQVRVARGAIDGLVNAIVAA